MKIEQRLHHAAHELRELSVDVPDFVAGPVSQKREHLLPTMVTSLLFVVGTFGLLTQTLGSNQNSAVPVEDASVVVEQVVSVATESDTSSSSPVMTPREEVALISTLAVHIIDTVDTSSSDETDQHIPPRVN